MKLVRNASTVNEGVRRTYSNECVIITIVKQEVLASSSIQMPTLCNHRVPRRERFIRKMALILLT